MKQKNQNAKLEARQKAFDAWASAPRRTESERNSRKRPGSGNRHKQR